LGPPGKRPCSKVGEGTPEGRSLRTKRHHRRGRRGWDNSPKFLPLDPKDTREPTTARGKKNVRPVKRPAACSLQNSGRKGKVQLAPCANWVRGKRGCSMHERPGVVEEKLLGRGKGDKTPQYSPEGGGRPNLQAD